MKADPDLRGPHLLDTAGIRVPPGLSLLALWLPRPSRQVLAVRRCDRVLLIEEHPQPGRSREVDRERALSLLGRAALVDGEAVDAARGDPGPCQQLLGPLQKRADGWRLEDQVRAWLWRMRDEEARHSCFVRPMGSLLRSLEKAKVGIVSATIRPMDYPAIAVHVGAEGKEGRALSAWLEGRGAALSTGQPFAGYRGWRREGRALLVDHGAELHWQVECSPPEVVQLGEVAHVG